MNIYNLFKLLISNKKIIFLISSVILPLSLVLIINGKINKRKIEKLSLSHQKQINDLKLANADNIKNAIEQTKNELSKSQQKYIDENKRTEFIVNAAPSIEVKKSNEKNDKTNYTEPSQADKNYSTNMYVISSQLREQINDRANYYNRQLQCKRTMACAKDIGTTIDQR